MTSNQSFTDYPVYTAHEAVVCFKCGSQCITDLLESGLPFGRGQWFVECRICGAFTWYDLERKEQ
jgi:hypothetical protein